MASFTERMIEAAKLNPNVYEEVEADTSATGQAMGVVVLSSVATGIGSLGMMGFSGLLWGTLSALIGWVVWAAVAFLVGTKLMPEPQTRSDMGELLRTTGFAASPGILRVVGVVPLVGWIIVFAASLWMLAAMVVAVRQALDYESTGRAIVVCVIGFVINVVIGMVIAGGAIGASALSGAFR